ncbi:asparagine synthase (glutamine-hydrolyzing) [Streptomyces sp. NRRL S-340]|uniref:asparagine synthase (glutamine-hydrolyzing) n=1 Tax=Streptomyces sp. NRRL S-340 TaxID=1463901 RepID=UPI0005618139|nr:asparagine synthase (glutamine-hydrolyzing) [Streptomyces sp. NRRL S-340]
MCRIFGHFNGVVTPRELQRVGALQRHGGPDGQGSVHDAMWSVGNNRLAIVDLDGGQQPYELLDGRIRVVFNGEIYNHDELRQRLRARGYTFSDRCDGSVLPALYDVYGDGFTEHLDGMYAIAVLDQRAEPRLVLATDHVGMKPLYYRWDPASGALHFSSEIPALLAFDAVSRTAWTPGLEAYLATKTPFGEQTMFGDIKVLPPAATAVCDRTSGLRVLRRNAPRPGVLPGDDIPGRLRAMLRNEVRRLRAADVPLASITSGGLDSGLVTAFAAEDGSDLHTFNLSYKGTWPGDERRFARQIAERTGAVYHQVEIDPATFPDLVSDVVWHLGQPNADPITVSTYALFRAVRDAGFKVALTGDGADEVFGGYDRMRAAAEARGAWGASYADALAVAPARLRGLLYTKDYADEVELTAALPERASRLLRDGDDPLGRITAFEMEYRLPAYHLRRVDHLSMAHSVEVRLPFCQRDVVAFGRALPDHMRISGGRVKRALYAAASGLLPMDVLNRPKQPFTLPLTAMLAPGQPLWDFARDMLGASRLRSAGQLDPGAVRNLFKTQADRPEDTAALTIWALLVHEVWRERFRPGARAEAARGAMVA